MVMIIKDKNSIRTKKFFFENKPIKQISHFNYLECDAPPCDYDNVIQNKL